MYAGTLLDIAMNHSDNLILKARQGDKEAFNRLMKLWYRRIYNYAFKYFSDHDLAMEVTQRTFISMNAKIADLRDPGKFRPWLYRIASNYCHDEKRKTKRESMNVERDMGQSEIREVEASEYNPDKVYQQNELAEILLDALAMINEDQREVVIMKEYEGLKFLEIAEILNISENTVKSRMYYGLSALRKILVSKNINKNTVFYG